MDNLKHFFGNVITAPRSSTQTPSDQKNRWTDQNEKTTETSPAAENFITTSVASSTLKCETPSLAISRSRTLSESSIGSESDSSIVINKSKRKDSEPYFWIM